MKTALRMRGKPLFIIALLLFSVQLILHFPNFRKPLIGQHVWRQTETQATVENFFEEDFNILNPRKNERGSGDGIFRKEFPLMQWLFAASYFLTGESVVVTRIWMFLIAMATVWGCFELVKQIFKNNDIAIAAAWMFSFSPAFFYYAINPLPDLLALCLGIWGIACFHKSINKDHRYKWLSAVLLSIATLCKLPFILFYSVPAFYYLALLPKGILRTRIKLFFPFALLAVLPVLWYSLVIPTWQNNGIVSGIVSGKVSGGEWWWYFWKNLVSTFPEQIINYAALPFFVAGLIAGFKRLQKSATGKLYFILALCILLYYCFELNMIKTVHDYYLFPFYPVIIILCAFGFYKIFVYSRLTKIVAILFIGTTSFTAWARTKNSWNTAEPGFNKDLLTYQLELKKAVPDTALCVVGNDISHHIFLYYLHKKGWVFDSDNYDSITLKTAIDNGAGYMYSDSRAIDSKPSMRSLLDTMLLQRGTIKIFKLKKSTPN